MKSSFISLLIRFTSFMVFLFLFLVTGVKIYAQRPQDLPDPDQSEPLELDTFPEILIYIGLPVLFVILYLWLLRRRKRSKD